MCRFWVLERASLLGQQIWQFSKKLVTFSLEHLVTLKRAGPTVWQHCIVETRNQDWLDWSRFIAVSKVEITRNRKVELNKLGINGIIISTDQLLF